MKRLRLVLLPLVLGSVVLGTASCESSQEKPAKNCWKVRSPYRKSYPKLKQYKLVLIPVGKKTFTADQKKEFNFSLRNIGSKTVRIDEWFMEEADNVRFYTHPFENKPVKFDRKTWKCWIPPMKKKTERFQLELMPGNAALIMTTMSFLDDLKPEDGKAARVLVVAELNLTSVNVRTMQFIVAVQKK
ncbi:hypothetical protein P0136_07355 [Lentisphaerota bacterium ZTH]|nr:hypothetical protein JYG24_01530 [Lentisphaerota bacterium]WET05185.1 hypothetical protein P0136_07355 [Lentisphaerota bacterium ZTH]